jgi:hypothetical protein
MHSFRKSRRSLASASVLLVALLASGCAEGEPGPPDQASVEIETEATPSPNPPADEQPAAEPEVITAVVVAEAIECGIFRESIGGEEIPGITAYDCTSLAGDGPYVVMFEATSEEVLDTWLQSGELEVGSQDSLVVIGSLAVLVTEENGEVLSRLAAF